MYAGFFIPSPGLGSNAAALVKVLRVQRFKNQSASSAIRRVGRITMAFVPLGLLPQSRIPSAPHAIDNPPRRA